MFTGDNLHEMPKPIFLERIRKKYLKMSSADNFTQHADGKERDKLLPYLSCDKLLTYLSW